MATTTRWKVCPTLATIEKPNCKLSSVKAWVSGITRIYECDRWEKILKDSRNAITPEDIRDVDKTKAAIKAQTLLESCEYRKVTENQFSTIWDYLIARLELENAQRSGPMETATLRDFKTAQSDGQGGCVIYLAKHKRSRAGPAPISMKQKLRNKIQLFVKHVRVHFVKKDENCLFSCNKVRGFQTE